MKLPDTDFVINIGKTAKNGQPRRHAKAHIVKWKDKESFSLIMGGAGLAMVGLTRDDVEELYNDLGVALGK